MRAVPVAIIALAGCATRTIVVAPAELARNATALSRDRRVVIYALDGKPAEVRANERVDGFLRDGEIQRPVTMTVGELVAGCEAGSASPGCAAERMVGDRAKLRRERSVDGDAVAKVVGFGAIGGLAGYCLAACQDESSVPRAFGYAALGIAGFTLLFLGAVALGGRD
jgi:hypothetical protein